jgi:hypothetical protein
MSAHEDALNQAQERAATLAAESDKGHANALSESQRTLESARAEAEALLASAREKAERIRRDSERELSAATARRDSITSQLSNVRQMLATLGGGAMLESLEEPAATAPIVQEQPEAEPEAEAHFDAGDAGEAHDAGEAAERAEVDESEDSPAAKKNSKAASRA